MTRRKDSGLRAAITEDTGFEQLFLDLQEYSFSAIIATSESGHITTLNRTARLMLGVTEHRNIIGRHLSDYLIDPFSGEPQNRTDSRGRTHMVEKRDFPSKMQCRTVAGRILHVDMTFFQYRHNGETCNLFILNDQTRLIEEQHIREDEERRFHAVADLIPIGILQTNERWECTYVNAAWCEMAGLDREVTSNGLGWVNAIHEDDSQRVLAELSDSIRRGICYEQTCRFLNPLGNVVWIDLNASPLIGENGYVGGFIATANDVTLHRTTEERLRRVAQYDPLTQLANRSLLHERLTHLLTCLPRTTSKVAVLYLDLDGFKHVNDSLGHDCGDSILKEVARRLGNCVRKNDTVSRLGGDEFTVILENVRDAYSVSLVAEKIIRSIAKPFQLNSQEIFLTTSVGITISDRNDNNAVQLLKQADIALYQAKAEGKNNYQFYSAELGAESRERLNLGNRLHRALEKKEFQVYFQPQASIESGCVTGFEALLRWIPVDRPQVPTRQFIPLLEETGLIKDVGRWLIEHAFSTFNEWLDNGLIDNKVHLSINLSPRQFRDKELLSTISRCIKRGAIHPGSIIFEITETLLLDDQTRCLELIQNIKDLGARIALDDFGTGFSSLSHLKNFPIDIIKIDQSFVQDVLCDKEDEAIVLAVLAMAESLNKITIAEGVDDPDILDYLQVAGCQFYQGFLLSRPVSKQDSEIFLTQNTSRSLDNKKNQPIDSCRQ